VQCDYALAKVEPDGHGNIYSNTIIFDAKQVVEHPTTELDALVESAKRMRFPSNDDSEPVQQIHRPLDFPEGFARRGRDAASTPADSMNSEYGPVQQVYPRPNFPGESERSHGDTTYTPAKLRNNQGDYETHYRDEGSDFSLPYRTHPLAYADPSVS